MGRTEETSTTETMPANENVTDCDKFNDPIECSRRKKEAARWLGVYVREDATYNFSLPGLPIIL